MATTLRLNDEELRLLRAMAEREGLSQHEVARRAIVERAQRMNLHDAVQISGARAVQRYEALLDRLAQ